jgi:hypothetical protein
MTELWTMLVYIRLYLQVSRHFTFRRYRRESKGHSDRPPLKVTLTILVAACPSLPSADTKKRGTYRSYRDRPFSNDLRVAKRGAWKVPP